MEGFGDDLTQPGHEACMVVVGHGHASEEGGAELFTERLPIARVSAQFRLLPTLLGFVSVELWNGGIC